MNQIKSRQCVADHGEEGSLFVNFGKYVVVHPANSYAPITIAELAAAEGHFSEQAAWT